MSDVLLVLIIILVVVVVLRGPKMLPRIGEALGRGVKETRKEVARGFGPDSTDAGDPPSSAS